MGCCTRRCVRESGSRGRRRRAQEEHEEVLVPREHEEVLVPLEHKEVLGMVGILQPVMGVFLSTSTPVPGCKCVQARSRLSSRGHVGFAS